MHINTKLRILEFVVAGVAMDLTENLIIVRLSTGETLSPRIIGIALLVVIPFAVITELIIDHPQFWHRVGKFFKLSTNGDES